MHYTLNLDLKFIPKVMGVYFATAWHANAYGAVIYQLIKVTDGEPTEKNAKNVYPVMEVGEGRPRSCKECIRTRQVTDTERSTNVSVTGV